MGRLRVAIIGCGLAGSKRAASLAPAGRLTWAADPRFARAQALTRAADGRASRTWRQALSAPDVDAVIVATPHHLLARVGLAALAAGKHVLLEKPGALRSADIARLIAAARRRKLCARVGYNHRFHPAVLAALDLVSSGDLGELFYVRARYGHGGRQGYEREWRLRREFSGGGEVMDQGTHLIDLARVFLGELKTADAEVRRYYWDGNVEDNGFLTLSGPRGRLAWLHASWTEWKNLFSFEITGRLGKLEISGLGGSYGVERLTRHRLGAKPGPPVTQVWRYPGADRSWALEFADFARAVGGGDGRCATLEDAAAILKIAQACYARAGKKG